jgi:predicted membrane protein
MRRLFQTKRFLDLIRTKKFYLPFVFAMAAILVWIGTMVWTNWKIASLVIAIILSIIGCKALPESDLPVYHGP